MALAQQQRHRHAVNIARGGGVWRIEIAVGVDPDQPQRATRGHALHRPQRNRVVAAQKNGKFVGRGGAGGGIDGVADIHHGGEMAQAAVARFDPALGAHSLFVTRRHLHIAEIDDIMALTLRVNDFLCGMFGAVGITLVDFKVEFGRVYENDFARVILADEISPDSCRLWDTQTNEKLDKDRFRRDLGNVIESYAEVARRLGIMKEMPTVIQGGLH